VQFYYALVDDLMSRDEFNRRVEERIEKAGGMIDEHTAAMLVVREAGRSHVRVSGISSGAGLVCLFARVVRVDPPRRIIRRDGGEGTVAALLAGDETGLVRVSLWDEKAEAVGEIRPGDVLEIVGRPKGGGREIVALAIREASCDIQCPAPPGTGDGGGLEGAVLHIEDRTFSRRDGSTGEMSVVFLGTPAGIVRVVCWERSLLAGVGRGDVIRIEGAVARPTQNGVEFSLDTTGSVTPSDAGVDVRMDRPADLRPGETCSIRGRVLRALPPRPFTTRSGDPSWVRNLVVECDGGEVGAVLWGEDALHHIMPGDGIEIYLGSVRESRAGSPEVHVGRFSAFRITPAGHQEAVDVVGTVIPLPSGQVLDTGRRTFLLKTPYPPAAEVHATGTVDRGILTPDRVEWAVPDPAVLAGRLHRLIGRLEPPESGRARRGSLSPCTETGQKK